MSYVLHIVRQNDYDNGDEESNISLAEWMAYVATDNELELTNGFETVLPGMKTGWQDKPGFCNWMKHPYREADTIPWFDFTEGSIKQSKLTTIQ
jgi:hypothetical protein